MFVHNQNKKEQMCGSKKSIAKIAFFYTFAPRALSPIFISAHRAFYF
jgi:hypothetical protein